MAHNKREALITSLSLIMDQRGNLILERKGVAIGSLKETLVEHYPEWDHLQATVDAARWVEELLNDTLKSIHKGFKLDESIHIQERDVRPEGEAGDDQDISEGE